MSNPNRLIVITSVLLTLAAGAAAQPSITGVNSAELPRSGRVAIEGFGFGSAGDVVIAGLSAWTTTWTDTRVVAYVPEAAPLGAASLFVTVEGQQSNQISLTVTQRQPDGRVLWTFEADGEDLFYRPARAPDGTLYLHNWNETDGILYALSPDGGLLWTAQMFSWPRVPTTAGPDGSLYVGGIESVAKLSPEGDLLWQFSDPSAQHIQVAGAIGPDGLLYGAFDHGIGSFALDAETGALEWSNTGDPIMVDNGNPYGNEVAFGPSSPGGPIDQMYIHMDFPTTLYALSLDGEQRFTTWVQGSISREPVVGSDGTIYIPAHTPGGRKVMAVEPENGQVLWTYDPHNGNGMSELQIGPDDTIYFVAPGHLEAFDPHTVTQRWLNANLLMMGRPALSPDGTTLVVDAAPNFNDPGFIKGFDAATGQELWSIDLPGDPSGIRVLGTHYARFTPDSAIAYMSTRTVTDGAPLEDPHSYLYAISVGEEPQLPGDVDGDGVVGILDFLAVLAAWGPCPDPCPPSCAADFDGDCQVGVTDFLILLGNWGP